MNLTKAQKIRLGTFVAVGTATFVGSILVLAGLKVWERRDLYTVRFKESVSGLERSSQVRYQGLRVGRVDAMRIPADDPAAVEVTLSLEAGMVLYEGTKAILDISGLTGLKNVNLQPGDPTKARILPGSRLPTGLSFVDRLTGKAEAISVKVEMVSNNLLKWTADDNRVRVEKLIDSTTKLSDDVDKLVEEARPPLVNALERVSKTSVALEGTARASTRTLNEVRQELKASLANLQGTLAEVRRILKAVDSKEVAGTLHSARSAMGKLDDRLSERELGKTLEGLQASMLKLTSLLEETDLAVRSGREDFVMSLKHVRQATEDLREFSRIIAQDPSVLLRGKEIQ